MYSTASDIFLHDEVRALGANLCLVKPMAYDDWLLIVRSGLALVTPAKETV
jgi:hypothetical protein